MNATEPRDLAGLTRVVAQPLERVPVRIRAREATLSAWRLALSSAEGAGAIVLVEASPEESHYRGEGICLGWPQVRLAAVWRALTARPDSGETDLELLQLG